MRHDHRARVLGIAFVALVAGGAGWTATAHATGGSCGRVKVAHGDTFAALTQDCYGSRTYQDWVVAHNHHEGKSLRAGETIELPPFRTLVDEQLTGTWAVEAPAIADAFDHFHVAEPDIEAQLHAASPGVAPYHPSTKAKTEIEAAVHALEPVVDRLKAAKVHTRKFAQALDTLQDLASGKGSFSTDYGVEGLHQCFSYGVDALSDG